MSLEEKIHFIFTLSFVIIGCTLLGYGINWCVGTGVFFIICGLIGIYEMITNKV
jgi:hypothetical protein